MSDQFVSRENLENQGWKNILRQKVRPGDLNAYGRLFAGRIMDWLDSAGVIYSHEVMLHKYIVTKKLTECVFHSSGNQGDMLEIFGRILKMGNSSLTIELRGYVFENGYQDGRAVVSCEAVFVAVDEDGRPCSWNKEEIREE